jgi:predicted metal-dependent hydrolase
MNRAKRLVIGWYRGFKMNNIIRIKCLGDNRTKEFAASDNYSIEMETITKWVAQGEKLEYGFTIQLNNSQLVYVPWNANKNYKNQNINIKDSDIINLYKGHTQ